MGAIIEKSLGSARRECHHQLNNMVGIIAFSDSEGPVKGDRDFLCSD